jgi:UDP-N-acetylmuramyl pentapeptide synthase
MLKLYNLIPNEVIKKYKINNIFIKGITCDSRKIKNGYIFAAFHGAQDTGTNYIIEAIHKGAVAILIHKKDYKKYSNINNKNNKKSLDEKVHSNDLLINRLEEISIKNEQLNEKNRDLLKRELELESKYSDENNVVLLNKKKEQELNDKEQCIKHLIDQYNKDISDFEQEKNK